MRILTVYWLSMFNTIFNSIRNFGSSEFHDSINDTNHVFLNDDRNLLVFG